MANRAKTAMLRATIAMASVACAGCGSPPEEAPTAWSRRFGDSSGDQVACGIAIDNSGQVILAGDFDGPIDFGGGPLEVANGSSAVGGRDVFLAKLGADGKHVWSKRFGDYAEQRATRLAVDGAGNIALIGWFAGTIDFGGGPLVTTSAASGKSAYLAVFDPSGGHLGSFAFGEGSGDVDVAAGPDGRLVLAGQLSEMVAIGGGVLPAGGFVAELAPNRKLVWSRALGGATRALRVATDRNGDAFLGGRLSGDVDLGGGPLSSPQGGLFLGMLGAQGNHVWSRGFQDQGTAGWPLRVTVAFDPAGGPLAAGTLSGVVDFGGGVIPAHAFLVAFDPAGHYDWGRPMSGFGTHEFAFGNGGFVLARGADSSGVDGPVCPLEIDRRDAKGEALATRELGACDGIPTKILGGSVALDPSGAAFVAGGFQGTLDFGDGPLATDHDYDVFVAKLAP